MTREEAIEWLTDIKENITENWSHDVAIDMAIDVLKVEPTKAVPPSLADVYKWERDIALSQLEEYGIGFAEKKRDDLVEVVRCKDCRYYVKNIPEDMDTDNCKWIEEEISNEDDYCSYGARIQLVTG